MRVAVGFEELAILPARAEDESLAVASLPVPVANAVAKTRSDVVLVINRRVATQGQWPTKRGTDRRKDVRSLA